MSEMAWKMANISGQATLAGGLGDFKTQLDYNHQLEALPEFSGQVENARQNDITGYASLHDGDGARAAYENLSPNSNALITLQRQGTYAFAKMILGEPWEMMSMREKFDRLLGSIGPAGVEAQKSQFWPFVAMGFALQGEFKTAHEWIDKTPADCMQCLDLRGRIDGLEKNWRGAEYWFARAVREAPSIPEPYSAWGHVLVQKGDYDGAIAKLKIAHEKGPNFADPLEMWGEALLAKHRPEEALVKFREANDHAPNWGRLHLKWGEALVAAGRKDEAQTHFVRAATLDLSAAEKSELAHVKHG